MQSDELQKHMSATYFSLRIGVALMAAALPLVLWIGGRLQGIHLQDSLSAYYHATSGGHSMRDWFVGIMFAVGSFLYLYKGYSVQENWALNFSGVCAVGLATSPMQWNCGNECAPVSAHGTFAVLFFIGIAYVCLFRAADTLHLLKDERREQKFRMLYKVTGILMVVSPLVALLLTVLLQQFKSYVYFVELVGTWTFAAYWILKSYELSITNAEYLALHGQVNT